MANPVTPLVVHVICSSGFYGAERVVANLNQAFSDINMRVLCLAPDQADLETFKQQVNQERPDTFIRIANSIPRAIGTLRQLKSSHQNLVIHAHGYKEIVIACLFQLFYHSSIVVTQHGFTSRNLKFQLYNWIDKACCRWAKINKVVVVSEAIAKVYQQFGVNPDRLLLLQNGVMPAEEAASQQARQTLLRQLGLKQDKHLVLFVGRLSAEKDPLLFVASLAALHQRHPEVYGVIAGDGPQMTQIKEAITSHNLDEQITCLGFVSDIATLMQAADVIMLTSQTEGTPMTILEAMANSTPVVAAKVGGLPTLIQSGRNGILINSRDPVDFANACARYIESDTHRENIIQAARLAVSEQFYLFKQRESYDNLYGLEPVK